MSFFAAELIEQGLEQSKRLIRLNQIVKKQLDILQGNAGIKKIDNLDNNKHAYYLILPISLILINSLIFKVDTSNKFINLIIIPIIVTYFLFVLINNKFKLNTNIFSLIFSIFLDKLFEKLLPMDFLNL